jgi:hypothetical protein
MNHPFYPEATVAVPLFYLLNLQTAFLIYRLQLSLPVPANPPSLPAIPPTEQGVTGYKLRSLYLAGVVSKDGIPPESMGTPINKVQP